MARPILSVVIPTHDRGASLAKALASLAGQDLDRSLFEIVVVSNLEDRRVQQVCEGFAGLTVRTHVVGEIGVNRARNVGFENSSGEIVYFLDDDCRIAKAGHLSRLVQVFREEGAFDLRGGPYHSLSTAPRITKAYNSVVNAWIAGRSSRAPLMAGGNFAVRRDVVGLIRFDESIVYGGSEVSFQLELAKRGAQAKWDEEMAVLHDADVTLLGCMSKAWRQGRTKRETGFEAGAKSLFALRRENFDVIAFGVAYGIVARVGWLWSVFASAFDSSEASGVLEKDPNLTGGSQERTPA